jgi:hypothetical protein
MFGASGALRRSKTQRLLLLSESRLLALRPTTAAGSGEGAWLKAGGGRRWSLASYIIISQLIVADAEKKKKP